MTEELKIPKLEISEPALQQIILIQRHDYTLKGLSFRIKIGGKGCDGFTYETGFAAKHPEDVIICHTAMALDDKTEETIEIVMDPFTAFYTQVAKLDYRLDPNFQDEGFILTNLNESLYKGKFYKDTTMVPPWQKA